MDWQSVFSLGCIMPWKVNPNTKTLMYYEKGVPEPDEPGKILSVDVEGNITWTEPDLVGSKIVSYPPADMYQVTNIYVNPTTGKTVVDYEDTPGIPLGAIRSFPPEGCCRVTNIYVNPTTNKTVVQYETGD